MSSPTNLPLQFVHPDGYRELVSILEERGLQPFDVEAEVITRSDETCTVRISYGNEFDNVEEYMTNIQVLERPDPSLTRFFVSVSELCHDALLQDYRTYMRTQ